MLPDHLWSPTPAPSSHLPVLAAAARIEVTANNCPTHGGKRGAVLHYILLTLQRPFNKNTLEC